MNGCYVIRNQLGHYRGRSKEWVKGGHPGQVATWVHYDEAVNTLFELGSRDTDLRGEILNVGLKDDKPTGLEISEHPIPKVVAESDGDSESAQDRDPALENTDPDTHIT